MENQGKASGACVVTANNVAFRRTPGLSGEIIRRLQKGEAISTGSEPPVNKDGYTWQLGCYNESIWGYVATTYLKCSQ